MYNIVTVTFKDSNTATANGVRQWDYGQILRIQGLQLPTAVEVHFALIDSKDSVTRIGITKDGVTDVVIPDSMIEAGKNIFAYVYLRDSESGQTEYEIKIVVTTRAKPEAFDTPEDKELFAQAIEAVNAAADRAEKAGQTAQEAAQKAGLDAEQTAQDRAEVAKMVETVTDISEQVKKVEDLSNKAQAAATKTEADAQQTAEDRVEVGKMLETVKDVSEQVKTVDESVRKAKESERAAEGHRTAVEEMKNSVEQTVSGITQVVQTGVQEINSAKQSAVQEVTQTGTAQKTAVESAGTQAVENVENAQQAATEAVETAKTEAVQSVQTEGTKQTGSVTAEGTKQVKAVQDKGAEVLQSIPGDFQTAMASKLDKQQGIENKGKALVIGEDGNVVPGEVASGGGDGIAIVNTTSGESPLVIPDSAERVNKGFGLTGKTEQVTTTGKNLANPSEFVIGTLAGDTGNIIGLKQYIATGYIPVIPGKRYSTSCGNKFLVHAIFAYDKEKTKINTVINMSSEMPEGAAYIRLSYKKIDMTNVTESDMEELKKVCMANEGSTVLPYEPYTGGKPSPSPEYPQKIKNAGKWNEETQKYEVDVKVTGKNLLNLQKEPDVKGTYQGWKVGNGELLTLGVKDKGNNADIKGCYIGFSDQGSESKGVVWVVDNGVIKTNPLNQRKAYVSIFPANETTVKKLTERFDIQCELGNVATPYQPYKEQTLTLTSDRPLTKWDRLVEQGGQIGWLYATKKHVVTGSEHFISGGVNYYTGSSVDLYFNVMDATGSQGIVKNLSDVPSIWHNKDAEGFRVNGSQFHIRLKNTRLSVSDDATKDEKIAAYKTYLVGEHEKGTPYEIVYQSLEPEFVPLPQSEQNAIRALKTYYPTTVITVDGGEVDPDIKVTYTADTKNYIDGKVSAKVASILRQYQADTANLLSLMPMETQATMIENDTNNILNNLESEEAHE